MPNYTQWNLVNADQPELPEVLLVLAKNAAGTWRVTWGPEGEAPKGLNFVTQQDAEMGVKMAFAMLRAERWELLYPNRSTIDLSRRELWEILPMASRVAARVDPADPTTAPLTVGGRAEVLFPQGPRMGLSTVRSGEVDMANVYCVFGDDGQAIPFDVRKHDAFHMVFDRVARATLPMLGAVACRIVGHFHDRTEFMTWASSEAKSMPAIAN